MKIAIVCDWLVTAGGAEQVLKELIECFPQADIYSVVDFFNDKDRATILKNKPVKTSYIQSIPFAKTRYRSYLPFMPLAIEQLDMSAYDLVLSSSHAVAKGVITGPNQRHISYIHSPMRYAWDLQHQYLKESGLDKGLKGIIAKYFLHKLRLWDQRTAQGVDAFLVNSNFIAKRVLKTYRREAKVIYPPVNIHQFTPTEIKDNFYLTASRLVPYKKIDLIVESFAAMPDKKLIVIGDGPDLQKIKNKAKSNIEIIGYQTTEALKDYMQRAKAFVFAAEEDFGIIPVEAQACGTPVIAYGKGGCLETVRGLDKLKPTGIFFKNQTIQDICNAIHEFEKNQDLLTVANCLDNTKQFSSEIFRNNIKNYVDQQCI